MPWDLWSWFTSGASKWLGGLGGDLASGIEGGFIATLKDIVGWMIPWFEIAAGVLIAVFVLLVYFHEDTIGLGMAAAGAALA